MDYITHDVKRDLMNKLKKGTIVKNLKVDGERFVVEAFDYNSLHVGLKRIYADGNISSRILWANPEYVVPNTLDEAHNYFMHDTVNSSRMMIKKVIFSNPATIVFWSDGSKTVVKSYLDDYDPEKGLAMAIAKKALGNEGNYYNVFKKWLPKDDETIGELFCDQKAIETYKANNDIINKTLEDIKKNIKTSIPSSWDGNFIYSNIRGKLENDKY